MGWRDLLQETTEEVVLPWIGGRSLRRGPRVWRIEGNLPKEHGWYRFATIGRKATLVSEAAPDIGGEDGPQGYLVGDLFVADGDGGEVRNPAELVKRFERVFLIEDGLDHFTHVTAYQWWDSGPLIFAGEEFPAGPEDEVRSAFIDRKESTAGIPGVPPALDLAFRMKTWHRAEVERRREEERLRREKEERRRKLRESLGDGETRREMALVDFEAAAKAALAVGGAEYIEHRKGRNKSEFVVRYRLDGSRYECVCDETMHILDAGICLQDHNTGEKGDTYFTLESLPGVTRQAMREGAAIWRHV